MPIYHMRNDILNTTDLAFKEHNPDWSRKLLAGTEAMSHEEALKIGISRFRTSKVNLSGPDIEALCNALAEIESQIGKDTVFSQLPISIATAAWAKLLEETRRGTISN